MKSTNTLAKEHVYFAEMDGAQGDSVEVLIVSLKADEDRESPSEKATESIPLVEPSEINEGKICWRHYYANTVLVS